MWDLEKIDSQNIEVKEAKNIVRHPEGVQIFIMKSVGINHFNAFSILASWS